MNISYILCLFLAVFSSACDDDKTDENNAKQVTVTISPSDKVIVEGEGGDISFTVTPSDPAVELRYVSSVEWMKAAAGGGGWWRSLLECGGKLFRTKQGGTYLYSE